MNYRMIAFYVAHITVIEALVMLPPLGIAAAQNDWTVFWAFGITIGLLVVLSLLLFLLRPRIKAIFAREGFVVTTLSWVLISLFGALPFYISGAIPNYIDCFFETVSGFTTTGASILKDVEIMPDALLYWRSFTHWLGGMGVLVFLLAIMPAERGAGASLHLLRAESPGPDVGKLLPKIRQGAMFLYLTYIALSVINLTLLLIGGMPLLDSLCTMFGTAGTGGFSVKNDGLTSYSPYLQNVVTIFMALFGVNFSIFYLLFTRQFSKALHDQELRAYIAILLISSAAIAVNIFPYYTDKGEAVRDAAFQVSSIMTTTGFATTDFNLWPEFSRTILMLLMIIGASAGSTGGGIKVSRLLILLKSIRKELNRMLHAREVRVIHFNDKPLDSPVVKGVNVFLGAYFLIAGASILLISIDNMSTTTNLTAVLSCIGNIGPGLDQVGPMSNYSGFSNFSKLVLSADMLLGRLEIFPILLLFSPSTWQHRPNIHLSMVAEQFDDN